MTKVALQALRTALSISRHLLQSTDDVHNSFPFKIPVTNGLQPQKTRDRNTAAVMATIYNVTHKTESHWLRELKGDR